MKYFDYQAAIFAADLSTKAKITALALASHYNWQHARPAFPSRKTLSEETGQSTRNVDRAKQELTEGGWISVDRRFNGPNHYTLTIPRDTLSLPSAPRDKVSLPIGQDVSTLETHWRTNSELNNESNNEQAPVISEDLEFPLTDSSLVKSDCAILEEQNNEEEGAAPDPSRDILSLLPRQLVAYKKLVNNGLRPYTHKEKMFIAGNTR